MQTAEQTADVVVVGVGTMGSLALWRLASRGASVIGLEQFEPGHDRGSGHGESRIIRTAYFEGPEYVPLIQASFPLWRELEAASGAELLTMTGALMIGRPDGELVAGALRSAREHNLTHELLDAEEARMRFSQHRLQDGEVALWEEQAGVLRPERSILAAAALAKELGARIVTGARGVAIRADGRTVMVRTDSGTYRARHLVISVGPWLGGLLPQLHLPLVVERQVMAWFPARQPDLFGPSRFPVFIHELGDVHCYGLPSLDGSTVKVAIHHHGRRVDPDRPDRDIRDADLQPIAKLVSEHLNGIDPTPARAGTCLYTNTPDEHFLVGPAPGLPNVVLLGGFSGHGFKFAPVMGEIAADLALSGRTAHPIGGFSPERFEPSRIASATTIPTRAQAPRASQDHT